MNVPDMREIADHRATASSEADQLIPRRIFQTFKSRVVPEKMYEASLSWITQNPEYDYTFFDDKSCRDLIEMNFDSRVLRAYDQIHRGALKADLWRYCALFLHGGVYADIDTVCLSSLGRAVESLDTFITAKASSPRQALFNAFIATTPRHPFMDAAIDRAVNNILSNLGRGPKALTGPTCLGEAINGVLGRRVDAPFKDGRRTINDLSIRVLTKIHSADSGKRRVVIGPEVLFYCKYQGYETDLQAAGTEHWHPTVYRRVRWLIAARRRYRRLRGKARRV